MNLPKINPLKDRVVIKRKKTAEKTESGILIPPTAQEKIDEGVVTAVGRKCEDVKQGDVVVFSKYSGTEITVNNETFVVLREDDVVAVLR